MNWRRGLIRLWVVASVAWAIGSTLWLAQQGAERAQAVVDLRCDVVKMPSEQYRECVMKAQGPEGSTWFLAGLRHGDWMLIVVPPILLLIIGTVVVKVCAWVTRGFSGP